MLPSYVAKCDEFLRCQCQELGSFDFDSEVLLWHYTTGAGLLGILESGAMYSTQVSCLNDSTEIRYAQLLFKNALTGVLSKCIGDERVKKFLTRYMKLLEDSAMSPSHAPSPFFVACFSREEDSLSQWRAYCGGENGYAIAFKAKNLSCPSTALVKVNYDGALHTKIADEVAEATARFYAEGLGEKDTAQAEAWENEFLNAWDVKISYLAPLVKDPGFSAENEYRIIREFTPADLKNTIIVQKKTMMTRHVSLCFPLGGEAWVPRLPIEKVMVGPCRHPSITGISVDTMLRKMGYGTGRVVHSKRPLQET